MKLCTFCSQPMKKKGHLCGGCSLMMLEINRRRASIPSKKGGMKQGIAYEVSQKKTKYLIDHVIQSLDRSVILSWFNDQHFHDWWTYLPSNRSVASVHKREIRERNRDLLTQDAPIPRGANSFQELPYIQNEFNRALHANQTLVAVRGTYARPIVVVACKSCKEEYACEFESFKRGRFDHSCRSRISTGELIVGEWLEEQGLAFFTQFDTYKVINPHTKYALPFDFELRDHRIIIEVHGDQHYAFIAWFHQTVENFQYQQWKDHFKKKRAEEGGFLYIELNYQQIRDGAFKDVIRQAVLGGGRHPSSCMEYRQALDVSLRY